MTKKQQQSKKGHQLKNYENKKRNSREKRQ